MAEKSNNGYCCVITNFKVICYISYLFSLAIQISIIKVTCKVICLQATFPFNLTASLNIILDPKDQQKTSRTTTLRTKEKVCRYCSLCKCVNPSDEDGAKFASWLSKYLYKPIAAKRQKFSKRRKNKRKIKRRRRMRL